MRISLAGGFTLNSFPFEKVVLAGIKLQRAFIKRMEGALAVPLLESSTENEEFVVNNGCRMPISFLGQDSGNLLWLHDRHVLLLGKSSSP